MSEDTTGLLERILPLLTSHGTPVYLVGGAVRDALLERPAYDLDFVVARDAVKLAFAAGDELHAAAYVLDDERDIGRVVVSSGVVLDFARFRGADLEADLRARDFTINAMAVDAANYSNLEAEAVIDPTGGFADLQEGVVRLANAGAIDDDPLRAVRAVRLAWHLGFRMTPETAAAVRQGASRLAEISAERLRDELLKIVQGPAPHDALRQMADLDLLAVTLPAIEALRDVEQSAPHHEPVLAHTLNVLQRLLQVETILAEADEEGDSQTSTLASLREALLPNAAALREHLARPVDGMLDGRAVLRLGALYHDVGKAVTTSVDEDGRVRFLDHEKEGTAIIARRLRDLRLSKDAIARVRTIVKGHMRPLHLAHAYIEHKRLSRRAVYRFFRDTGDAGVDILLLSLADHLATYDGPGPESQWQALQAVARRLLMHFFEQYKETVSPEPLLNGSELIAALNLKPGPEVGRLLRLLQEAQAVGEVETKEEALLYAKKRLRTRD